MTVPLSENTEWSLGSKTVTGQLLYVPDAGTNLLGRDLRMKLGIQITTHQEGMTVSMNVLPETDEKDIDPMVWAKEGSGGVENNPFKNKAAGKI